MSDHGPAEHHRDAEFRFHIAEFGAVVLLVVGREVNGRDGWAERVDAASVAAPIARFEPAPVATRAARLLPKAAGIRMPAALAANWSWTVPAVVIWKSTHSS